MRLLETTTLDYVSINTTFDFKIPKLPGENYTLFISAGPRVDYLFNSRVVLDLLPEERIVNWNQLSAGLLIGFGVRYDISRLQLGIRGDYYANFLPPTKGRNVHTFNVHLTVGYKLFP